MTGPKPGPPPLLVLDVECDSCRGVLTAHGEDADRLRSLPGHTALMASGQRPTGTERTEFLARVSALADRAGWRVQDDPKRPVKEPQHRLPDGRIWDDLKWRCPDCYRRHGDKQVDDVGFRELLGRHAATP